MAAAIVGFVVLSPKPSTAGEWREHAAKLSQLSRQMEVLEGEIKSTIEQKKKTQDRTQLKNFVSLLAQKHAELSRVSKEYEIERLHVRFSHPKHSEDVERKYVRHRTKTLREFEKASDLDGRLTYMKSRVQMTFPVAADESRSPEGSFKQRNPAAVSNQHLDEELESADLPEQIRLTK